MGLQWDTRGDDHRDAGPAAHSAMENTIADAIAQLFYTHRQELFHIWHAHFDTEKIGSVSAAEFVASAGAYTRSR